MLKTRGEIKEWLSEMGVKKYTINEDLTVDVEGNVDIVFNNFVEFPIQFGIVKGRFDCSHNKLKSLKGSPREVIGDFDCGNNKLTSLEFAPKRIGRDFILEANTFQSFAAFDSDFNRYLIHRVSSLEQRIPQLENLYEVKKFLATSFYELLLTPTEVKAILFKNKLSAELDIASRSHNKKMKV